MKRNAAFSGWLMALCLSSSLMAAPISWTGGAGDNSWHTAGNWSGGYVPTPTNDVLISVAGSPTIAYTTGSSTVRSIQCDEAFVLAGGTLQVTTGATLFNGPTTLTSAGSFGVDGAGATVSFNGPLLRAHSNLIARRGSRINLPTLTSLVMTNDTFYFSGYDAGTVLDVSNLTNLVVHPTAQFQVYAYSGASLDLHQLSKPAGSFYAYCTGAGSRIDLSGFAGRLSNSTLSGIQLEAWSGAALVLSNVTAMDGVDLVIRNNGVLPTAQLTEFLRGRLALYAATNSFSALTNLLDASLDFRSGAKAVFSNVTALAVSNAHVNFTARDAGTLVDLSNVTNLVGNPQFSFTAATFSGAKIDLRRLPKPHLMLDLSADGLNSVIDLSTFAGLLNPSPVTAGLSRLAAVAGGSLLVSNVTSLERVKLELRTGGKAPIDQLKAITRGSIIVYGQTNSFVGVTNIDATTMDIRTAGKISFPNVRSLAPGTAALDLVARDAGTLLDLSSVTNILNPTGQYVWVSVYTGGRIDLRGLPRPPVGFEAYADGAGATLDLSGFAGRIATATNMTLEVRNNGAIQMPNVTELDGVDLTIRNNGQIATAQLTTLTRAALSVFTSTNDFGSLRDIQDTDIELRSGAKLTLPGITRLWITNGSVQLIARDAGTVLDLSSVTNIAVGPASALYASGLNGGRIDLRNVLQFSEGLVQILAYDPGSVVDLSSLRAFVCPHPSSLVKTLAGGSIAFGTNPCILGNTTIDLAAGGALPAPFAADRQFVVLHAQPWRSYLVEFRIGDGVDSDWKYWGRVPLTNSFQIIGRMPAGQVEFRVSEFISNPSLLDLIQVTNRSAQLVLYGMPGKNYRIESTVNLLPPADWQPGPLIGMTNSFRLLPLDTANPPTRLLRGREE